MIKFDLEKLIELVAGRPGITSRQIIKAFNVVCENPKSADNALNRVREKYEDMEDSPIFFQKYGTTRHWYTSEYAIENNLKPFLYKEDIGRNPGGENDRYAKGMKLINSLWKVPGLAH